MQTHKHKKIRVRAKRQSERKFDCEKTDKEIRMIGLPNTEPNRLAIEQKAVSQSHTTRKIKVHHTSN